MEPDHEDAPMVVLSVSRSRFPRDKTSATRSELGCRALRQATPAAASDIPKKLNMLRVRFYRFRLDTGYGRGAVWMRRSVLRKLLHAWQHVAAAGVAARKCSELPVQLELPDDHKQNIGKALGWCVEYDVDIDEVLDSDVMGEDSIVLFPSSSRSTRQTTSRGARREATAADIAKKLITLRQRFFEWAKAMVPGQS